LACGVVDRSMKSDAAIAHWAPWREETKAARRNLGIRASGSEGHDREYCGFTGAQAGSPLVGLQRTFHQAAGGRKKKSWFEGPSGPWLGISDTDYPYGGPLENTSFRVGLLGSVLAGVGPGVEFAETVNRLWAQGPHHPRWKGSLSTELEGGSLQRSPCDRGGPTNRPPRTAFGVVLADWVFDWRDRPLRRVEGFKRP